MTTNDDGLHGPAHLGARDPEMAAELESAEVLTERELVRGSQEDLVQHVAALTWTLQALSRQMKESVTRDEARKTVAVSRADLSARRRGVIVIMFATVDASLQANEFHFHHCYYNPLINQQPLSHTDAIICDASFPFGAHPPANWPSSYDATGFALHGLFFAVLIGWATLKSKRERRRAEGGHDLVGDRTVPRSRRS